jgi:ribosomal protein L7/L12
MLDKMEQRTQSRSANREGKREKFVKLAEARTKSAIKAIRIIAKLGNKNAYDYSEADVKRIASALTREVDALKARMSQSGGKELVEFSL